MRIDLALYRLRLARSRSIASGIVEAGHVRRNGERVTRVSTPVATGDVLTFPIGRQVRIIEILSLPSRRGPATEAQACYRMLDPRGESGIAGRKPAHAKEDPPQ